MSEPSVKGRVVGVTPWLPWPLSAWPWWTRPVRAERLAALRIGLAACLLLDVLLTYLPNLHFYDAAGLGHPAIYAWYRESPRLNWTLLRGFGDPLASFVVLGIWLATTLWLAFGLCTRRDGPPRLGLSVWTVAGVLLVLGVWARQIAGPKAELAWLCWVVPVLPLALLAPAVAFGVARRRFVAAGVSFVLLTLLGVGLLFVEDTGAAWWAPLLAPWQDDALLLRVAAGLWAVATLLLLLGFYSRTAAALTWVLAISFANVNCNVDNAGDVIRNIALFYLMLSPCGAAWSFDRWLSREPGDEPTFVPPWPLRLLFVQLVLIYFFNGLYKLLGAAWWEGDSLYNVLGDPALTRVSPALLPLPYLLTRLLSWGVLIWEVSFPLWMVHRWTRAAALGVGVAFHLGIFATMELGGFVPYVLCLYLPLLPWERRVGGPAKIEPAVT